MLKFNLLNGNTIKKLTNAKRVRKTYYNKYKDGSGNFGFVVILPPKEWYRIDGNIGKDGFVYNMKVTTYGPRDFTEKQGKEIKIIEQALYKISIGNEEKPKPIIENKKKIPVKEVIIHWREGSISSWEKYPMKFKSIKEANRFIMNNAYRDGPKSGGYNKHKFTVIWEDGEDFQGRMDVKYPTESDPDLYIGKHIKDFLIYMLNKADDTTQKEKDEIRMFLSKYDLED